MTTFPVAGARVTAGFGPYPTLKGKHYGIDLGAPAGTPIRANRAGVVIAAGYDQNTPSFGYHVRVRSGDLVLIYGHMQAAPLVYVGQRVAEGAHLGDVGHTGNATGNHLHFEVRRGGLTRDCAVNPAPYLYPAKPAPKPARPAPAPKPKPTPIYNPPVLRRGSSGRLVRELQAGLLRVFPSYADPIRRGGGPNGIFGPATERVVREFQKRAGIRADGIVTAGTWVKLGRYGIKA